MKYLYLLIDGLTLAGPLVLSFDRRVAFFRRWKYLFPSIGLMMAVFVPWDMAFTHMGVWRFNPQYLSGYRIFNLPIEEVLFFVVVPYACVFIYDCLNSYIKNDVLSRIWRPIGMMLAIALIGIGVWKSPQLYTSITFIITGVFLLFNVLNRTAWFSRFLLAYFVSVVPFCLVNGVLTGSWIEDQIVWYNSDHIINVRVGTIPIEDVIYSLLMLGLTVCFLEYFTKKGGKLR